MRINTSASWEPGKPGPYLARLIAAIEAASKAAGSSVADLLEAMADTDSGPSRLSAPVMDSLIEAGGGPSLRQRINTEAVPEFLLRRRNDEPEDREPLRNPRRIA